MLLENETPFEVWLTAQIFEAKIEDDSKREKWTGLYFLASDKQVYFALSILERLILPDEIEVNYRVQLMHSSTELCTKIIDRLLEESEIQVALFNPQKQFIYHMNLP